MLEQLLRTCPNVLRVLVLVRGKRGVSPQDRLRSLLDHELFHLLPDNRLLKVKLPRVSLLHPIVDVWSDAIVRQKHIFPLVGCAF